MLTRWLQAGYDHIELADTACDQHGPGAQCSRARFVLVRQRWLCPGVKRYIVHTHSYEIEPDGTLSVANRFDVDRQLPELPRIGVSLVVPAGLEQLEWFGNGPFENYSDRNRSSRPRAASQHCLCAVRALHPTAGAWKPHRRSLAESAGFRRDRGALHGGETDGGVGEPFHSARSVCRETYDRPHAPARDSRESRLRPARTGHGELRARHTAALPRFLPGKVRVGFHGDRGPLRERCDGGAALRRGPVLDAAARLFHPKPTRWG